MKAQILKKKIFSWAMYDFANTAYSALFVSFFYPFYIKHFLGGNEFQIGLAMGISMFFVVILVPFFGAFVDLTGKRVFLIRIFTLICVAFTILVAFSNLHAALFFGLLANFFYHSCVVMYNAILPTLATKKEMGYVSGFGVAVGYLGTIVSLGMAAIILNYLGWETREGIRAMFPAIGAFFLFFALLLFIFVKDKKESLAQKTFLMRVQETFHELKETVLTIPKYKGLVPFLLSSFSYSNAITAVVLFVYLYARQTIHLKVMSFMVVYLISALAAAGGSFIGGILTDKIGARNVLAIAGIMWMITLIFLFFPSLENFVIVGVLGGASMGMILTANRPMVIMLSPSDKVGQFFGFYALSAKSSGVIAPILFGYLVVHYGYNAAIVSLMVFFGIGLVFLKYVPNKVY